MKIYTKIAIALAALVVVVAGIAGLALVPAVQKWAVKKALANEAGAPEVEYVSAGPNSTEIRNLKLMQDGAVISLASARAKYSAWGYLAGGAIQVESVDARGIVVDLRNYVASETTETTPFEGILGVIALPAGLRLGSAEIEMEVILPSPDSPEGQRLHLTVKGGGVEAGKEAAFDYNARFTDPAPAAAVSAVKATGRATVQSAADGSVDSISATVEVQAEGDRIPQDERILLGASLKKGVDRRELVGINLSRRGSSGQATPLLVLDAAINPGAGTLMGNWSLTIDEGSLAAVLPAETTPGIEISGQGTFSLNPNTGAAGTSGGIKGTLSQLERVMPGLEGVGALGFNFTFSGASDAGKIRLDELQARVFTPGGAERLAVELLQVVTFDTATGLLAFADPAKDIGSIAIGEIPVAWGAPFAGELRVSGGDIAGGFLVQCTPAGDHIRVRPSRPFTIRDVTVSDGTDTLLERATFTVSAGLDYAAGRIEAAIESWTLTTAAGDRIAGTVQAGVVLAPAIEAEFKMSVEGSLPALLKPFSPVDVGTISINGGLDGSLAGERLQLRSATFTVKDGSAATLLSNELLQPVDVDLASMQASVKNTGAPAARLAFGNLPLAWAGAFVPDAKLAGAVERGAVEVSITPDGYAVTTKTPVSIKGVSVAMAGEPLVENIDATWDGSAHAALSGDSMAVKSTVRQLEVRQGSKVLFTMKGDFESNGATDPAAMRGSGKGSIEADIAALLAQPAAAGWRVLEKGRLAVSFDMRADGSFTGKMDVTATDLVATEGHTPLGRAALSAEGRFAPGEGGEFRLPVWVENGDQKSDVLIEGTLAMQGGRMKVFSRVSGDKIFTENFTALAALAPATEEPPAQKAPAAPPAEVAQSTRSGPAGAAVQPQPAAPPAGETAPGTLRDERPPWAGIEGSFELDVKSLIYNPASPITNLKARAVVASDRVELEGFEATLTGNPVKASAALRFDGSAAKPYALTGGFDVPKFDIGAFMRTADPNSIPSLEGVVAAHGSFTGGGINIEDVVGRAQGRVDVTGAGGVFRGLARTSTGVSAGASVLGSLLRGKRGGDAAQAVAELANELREFRFDNLAVRMSRGDDLKLTIETVELASPTMRLTGHGLIELDPGIPLVNQAQHIEMQLAFKGSLADSMTKSLMTDGTTDDLGYARFRVPIILTGTLMSPNSKQFWEAVMGSVGKMGIRSLLPGG